MRTVRHADKICVIAQGRVEEQGTHDELLQRDGLYAKLVVSSMDERLSVVSRSSLASFDPAASGGQGRL
ncbi:hypothetical protein P43SY_010381 [Pythium insidiosum]|uniref:Uncharacterized protein n=1 Tax=Pythium insidiosum TaxID=114742 RepID=A0AAD5Q1Y7_PYTIN|nr:hypothetical protein P43SY_010381 [Pythium insidiosum]